MPCRRYIVRGHVQGVWFRASAREQAMRLGLDGHAVNLPDGGVEVVASGDLGALDTLAAWLRRGPELARVEHVSSEPWPEPTEPGFRTG